MSEIKTRFKARALAAGEPIAVQTDALGLVYVKRITVASSKQMQDKNGRLDEEKALLHSVSDEYGNLIFDSNSADDVAIVRDLSKHEVASILLVIYTGNGLAQAGQAAAEKN
jgi:hypothetical protein